jgi:hypothetical protein
MWYILLIKCGMIKVYDKVQILKDFKLYFFEIRGIPSVLSDRFLQSIITV